MRAFVFMGLPHAPIPSPAKAENSHTCQTHVSGQEKMTSYQGQKHRKQAHDFLLNVFLLTITFTVGVIEF